MAAAYGEWCAPLLPCSRVLLLVFGADIMLVFHAADEAEGLDYGGDEGRQRYAQAQFLLQWMQASGKQVAQHQLDSSMQPQPAAALHVVQHGFSAGRPAGAATALQLAAAAAGAGVSAAPG